MFIFLSAVSATVFASHNTGSYLDRLCSRPRDLVSRAICELKDRVVALEANQDTGKHILDLQQVRGSLWENSDPTNNVATPDQVTINCTKACHLWVNYDVDTRNTSATFQHLYFIYVDGADQAVFNQATMTVPNAAVPLAVNGVFPVAVGLHTVSIYARTYGGTLQQHESHLQVMAVEQ